MLIISAPMLSASLKANWPLPDPVTPRIRTIFQFTIYYLLFTIFRNQ